VFRQAGSIERNPASGLNPFIFRAGVQAHIGDYYGEWQEVLIPLSSGLVFRPKSLTALELARRLNPFIFRAGVQARTTRGKQRKRDVLIPLSSGLVFRQLCILKKVEAEKS